MLLLGGLQPTVMGTRTSTKRSTLGYTVALAQWKRATEAGLECPKPEKCDCHCDCSVSATIFPTKKSPAPCVPIPPPPGPVGGIPAIAPPSAPVYSAAPPMAAASSLVQQRQLKHKGASRDAPCATALGEVIEEKPVDGKVLECARWTAPNETAGTAPPELCSYLCQLSKKCEGFAVDGGGFCVLFEAAPEANPFDALEGNASSPANSTSGGNACSELTKMEFKKAGSIEENIKLTAASAKAGAFRELLKTAKNGGDGVTENITELELALSDAQSAAYDIAMEEVGPVLAMKTSTAPPSTTRGIPVPTTTLHPLSWAARHPECPQGTPCNCDCRCRGPPHEEAKKPEAPNICPPGFQPYVPEATGAAGGKRADSLQGTVPMMPMVAPPPR